MNNKESVETTIRMKEISVNEGEMRMIAEVEVRFGIGEQTKHLLNEMERVMEESGQQYKRKMYKYGVERADKELVERKKEKDEISRIGKKPYTIKAVFGKVKIDRTRIRYERGGTEIPSGKSWGTGQQVYTTKGLRNAVCDLLAKESITGTVSEIEKRCGEKGLLSGRSVLNILHKEGEALIKAQEKRAEAVFERIPEARILLVEEEKRSKRIEGENIIDGEWDKGIEEEMKGSRIVLGFNYNKQIEQSKLDARQVIAQFDEVKVRAQPRSGKKELLVYTSVVITENKSYYISAAKFREIFRQVGSLMAVLGVHEGKRELCVLGDGAHWIRNWYKQLKVDKKIMVLCWYHLTRTCIARLRKGFGKDNYKDVLTELLKNLWRGDVATGLEVLEAQRWRIMEKEELKELNKYLRNRRSYIVDTEARRRAGQWIANTQVEKFNNWSVAIRCKEKGMMWAQAGVMAIAALETARRNGELDVWRSSGNLPEWDVIGQELGEG